MAKNKTKRESIALTISKVVLGLSFIVSLIVVSGIALYVFTRNIDTGKISPSTVAIKSTELSSDAKSILNADTKEVIFTIGNADKYLKDSGYAYDPETFQNTNEKYAGDCFLNAALSNLSNPEQRIVFSTGCLPGDLPKAWIGTYDISAICPNMARSGSCARVWTIRFLIASSGRNFVWSADDRTITYEADLGLSGMTETRTIDSMTGEVLERKDSLSVNDLETKNWQDCKNKKYGYEVKYPLGWKVWLSGAPEARLANCDENLSLIAFSPNIYTYSDQQQINIDVYDQDRSRGTVWEGITSLNDYLNKKAVKIKKETTIDGERLIWVDASDSQLITFNDRLIYNFNFNNIDDSTLDRFLNTFKFIDKDETADWKTYKNEEYGFEFKYPEERLVNPPIIASETAQSGGMRFNEFDNGCSLVIFKGDQASGLNPFDESDLDVKQRQYLFGRKMDSGHDFYYIGMAAVSHAVDPDECEPLFNEIFTTLKFIGEDEIVDWKTYNNENWTIELPVTYDHVTSGEENYSDSFVEKTFQGVNIADLPTETLAFSVIMIKNIETKSANISLLEHVESLAAKSKKYDEYFGYDIQTIEKPIEVKVGDKSVIKTALFVFESCPRDVYWFEKGAIEYLKIEIEKCYEFGGPFGVEGLTDEQRLDISKEIQQILSTFKFTEPDK